MIKIDNFSIMNVENAIRGMRHPHKSHARSDSYINEKGEYVIGPNDTKLCKQLITGGPVHRKFLRQIFISMDITAPLYWWKEMDQYKVGTTTNSESTMHRIEKDPINLSCFSIDVVTKEFEYYVDFLELQRKTYLLSNCNKDMWRMLIQMLPSSWNQKRTWTGSCETVLELIKWRKGHKLIEWRELAEFLLKNKIIELFWKTIEEGKL